MIWINGDVGCRSGVRHSFWNMIKDTWQVSRSVRLECERARSDTHLNTSSRLRFPLSDCLRPFSSRKHGEYRLSNFVPPVCEACITPATNGQQIISCFRIHSNNVKCYYTFLLLQNNIISRIMHTMLKKTKDKNMILAKGKQKHYVTFFFNLTPLT